jgi:hypothetical protein
MRYLVLPLIAAALLVAFGLADSGRDPDATATRNTRNTEAVASDRSPMPAVHASAGIEGPAEADGETLASPSLPLAPARPGVASGVEIAASPPATAGSPASAKARAHGESRQYARAVARMLTAPEYAANVAPVARLYLAAFERIPDFEGFEYYVGRRGRGAHLSAIADEFASSAEFRQRYGELDHAAFIDRIRHNVLGDVTMPPGWLDAWAGQLEAGHMTRGEVMIALSESPEFRAVTEHEVFVSMAYAQALQRAPDSPALQHWVGFLDAGNSREDMIAGLLGENFDR